jgi:uncharacterized membrane protein YjgN (DUF898 family)
MSDIPTSPGSAPSAAGSPATATVAASPSSLRNLALQFTGSPREYFRIWIVNVCLTLLTLGVFSAWAKVRKKRYFYSHTRLDGTPFQYLGQPIPILKGRLIAASLFLVWYTATHFVTTLIPFVLVLALILAPWVAVRAAAFNARYSAYRNMTFSFAGTYLSAAKVMYGWAIVTLVTLGIAFSWWHQRIKRFLVTQTSFGDISGEFSATGGQFFKTYFIAGLLFMGTAIGMGVLFGALSFAAGANKSAYTISVMVVIYTLYVMAYAYTQTRITNLTWNNTQLGPLHFRSTIGVRSLLILYITNALGIIASVGLLIPWATIRTLKYRADHLSIDAGGNLADFRGSDDTNVKAAGAEISDFFDFDMSL